MAELAAADVFVLPTLAEGSATVIFEALALGIPVVTTKSAGSAVTSGNEGLIVRERDAESLADAIDQIVCNRTLHRSMSAEAVTTAAEYTEAQWGDRLLAALQSIQ
jgi:glycosyltransferase involved in cell wall biosynthesis